MKSLMYINKSSLLFLCVSLLTEIHNLSTEKSFEPKLSKEENISGDNKSFKSLDSETKLSFKVKTLYVEEFTVYSLASLGIKTSGNNNEIGHSVDIGNQRVIYNFGYDLKRTQECKFDEKQVFLKTIEGQQTTNCQPLANSLGKGNTWYIGKKRPNIIYKNRIKSRIQS